MSNIIDVLEQEQLKSDLPAFRPSDTVQVHVKVVEGARERIQVYEGVVIKIKGGGIRETFTVRRVAYGVKEAWDLKDDAPAENNLDADTIAKMVIAALKEL